MAKTGEKTIRYEAEEKTAECTFNYSDDAGLMGTTAAFLAIADTMQRGERLQHELRYDRLGLDAEMESLVAAQKDGSAIEIGNIASILQTLVSDDHVIDRVRRTGGAAASGLGAAGAGGVRSERTVELGHRFKRDSFSADLRGEIVRPGVLQLRCGKAGGAEIVREGFPFLCEAGAEEAVETLGVDVELGETGGEIEADDRRVDVRRRREGRGWKCEETLDVRVELREGGERTVVADARVRGDAVGDLALHHEHGAAEKTGARGDVEVKQDVGGDVVREIADDVERRGLLISCEL